MRRCATCRWPGSATCCISLALSAGVGFTCNCPESPETAAAGSARDRPRFLAPPRRFGKTWLTAIKARAGRRQPAEARGVRFFRRRRRGRAEPPARGGAPSRGDAACWCSATPGVRAVARPARPARACAGPIPAARRSAPKRSASSALRRQPEAELRADRAGRAGRGAAATARSIPTRSAARPRRRNPHRRRRRGAGALGRRSSGAITNSPRRPPRALTEDGGCAPATPALSTGAASSSSSTGRAMSASSPTARAVWRRNIVENKLQVQPLSSARRWCSATAARLSRR